MRIRPTAEFDVTRLPQPHEYWKRPEPSERGDTDSTSIYLAVGMTLSKWEEVENNFALLFGKFTQSGSHAAGRAYGSIASSSGRRDALSAAADAYFDDQRVPDDQRTKHKLLLNHFQQAGGRRNEIAHARVIRIFIEEDDRGAFLVPPEYNTRKQNNSRAGSIDHHYTFLTGMYRYTSEDIFAFSSKFEILAATTMRYIFAPDVD